MPEALLAPAAVVPGLCVALAIAALARRLPAPASLARPLQSRLDAVAAEPRLVARRRVAAAIDRAGWRETPERIAALTAAVSAVLAALGLSSGIVLGAQTGALVAVAGAACGPIAVAMSVRSAARRRRRRLMRELAPLLELFVLELGGGGSPLSALGSVTMQIDGELAAEIRRLLIASQVTGSATFETRLRAYADLLQIPPLASLATILVASREYGTGVTQGVRALAADLRRAQRRELIAHSRRALNHVLFPAAIGVLLPFLAILLYPAVTSLQANLR
ncbi:MAG TPA: type II secretion system F family protein [Candidatus Dormibacteraeota bacterium]|nr:type II secretion system F family protein [Candidatus Dormibacteraeota bacterium]